MRPMRYAALISVLVLGCGGAPGSAGADAAPVAEASGGPDTGPTDGPGRGIDGRTGDTASPAPGTPVSQPALRGQGTCAGTTLGQVIADIYELMPALADITVIEGMDPNVGGDGNRIYAFLHDDGFRLVFKRGSGDCPSGCIDNEYWYFATGAGCAPALVGHHLRASSGSCLTVEGTALWGRPPPVDPSLVCGADNSPKNITGTYDLLGTGNRIACTEKAAAQPQEQVSLALKLVVFQTPADLGQGTVTVVGTGNPLIDGVPLPGKFTRQRVTAALEVDHSSVCIDQHRTSVQLDVEKAPTGTLEFFEVRSLGCPPATAYCKGELHLALAPAR
jgi:hypothetical protein